MTPPRQIGPRLSSRKLAATIIRPMTTGGGGRQECRWRFVRATTALCAISLCACGSSDAVSPTAGPGPRLSIGEAQVEAMTRCFPATAPRAQDDVVLLVPGTGENSDLTWFGTYAAALQALGYEVCTLDLPDRLLDDIQTSAEFVVFAIRKLARERGAGVDLIAHSQGGLVNRWALTWWPDIEDLVDDYISLATPQHGTIVADGLCQQNLIGCTEAVQQQRTTAAFIEAINREDETPGGVSYTNIYSLTDEIVPPVANTSALDGASNILVQSVCPLRPVTHLGQLTDAAVFALALDALSHPGPADPERFDAAICLTPFGPGMEPAAILLANSVNYLEAAGAVFTTGAAPEPPLRDYAAP